MKATFSFLSAWQSQDLAALLSRKEKSLVGLKCSPVTYLQFLLWLLVSSSFPFLQSHEYLEHCFSVLSLFFKHWEHGTPLWSPSTSTPPPIQTSDQTELCSLLVTPTAGVPRKAWPAMEDANQPHGFNGVGELFTKATGRMRANQGSCWLRNRWHLQRSLWASHLSVTFPLHTATSRYHKFSVSSSDCKPFSFLW